MYYPTYVFSYTVFIPGHSQCCTDGCAKRSTRADPARCGQACYQLDHTPDTDPRPTQPRRAGIMAMRRTCGARCRPGARSAVETAMARVRQRGRGGEGRR
eukprot:1594373-Prymnesium_polylepis.1